MAPTVVSAVFPFRFRPWFDVRHLGLPATTAAAFLSNVLVLLTLVKAHVQSLDFASRGVPLALPRIRAHLY